MRGTLTPVLSIAVSVLVYFFFIQPRYEEVLQVKEDITAHEDALAKYLEFNNEVRALLAKRDSVSRSDRERLDLLIPSKIDTTRLLVDLESLARTNGLLFGDVDISGDAANPVITGNAEGSVDLSAISLDSLETADISFGVIGTYTQFKQFMDAVTQSLPLFEVTEIQLEVGEETFQQFKVTIRTYAIPEK